MAGDRRDAARAATPPSERERDFVWFEEERLIRFGAGALGEAPALLAERGFEGYALLASRRALAALPEARPLADASGVVLEVPGGQVPEVAAALREGVGRRALVALGGGRVIDTTKAVAAAEGLRCAAIPTTLSGAEVTRIHRLPAGVCRPSAGLVRPEVVIADPGAMTSLGGAALVASAMNALAHGVEALYGPDTNPAVQAAALRGAELLTLGVDRGEAAGEALGVGSLLCAWALDAAGLGLHHALCQTIVRTCGTPHAKTNAVMLPHVARYMADHAPSELRRLAPVLDAPEAAAEAAARRVRTLAAGARVTRLSELGVRRDQLDTVVDLVLERPELETSPGRPGRQEVTNLVGGAL